MCLTWNPHSQSVGSLRQDIKIVTRTVKKNWRKKICERAGQRGESHRLNCRARFVVGARQMNSMGHEGHSYQLKTRRWIRAGLWYFVFCFSLEKAHVKRLDTYFWWLFAETTFNSVHQACLEYKWFPHRFLSCLTFSWGVKQIVFPLQNCILHTSLNLARIAGIS